MSSSLNHSRRHIAKQTAGSLLLVVVFGVGYLAGQLWPVEPTSEGSRRQFLTGQDTDKPEAVDFSRFWTAWNIADQGYYGRGGDDNTRVDGAIAGMLSSLGDPYTTYLPKEENQLFQTDLTGSFSGIGAELSSINGFPTVVAPLPGSPAERAGLKAKDVILKVDDDETEAENFAAVINRIRGATGTTVTLTIAREGQPEPLTFKIVREKIELPNVTGGVEQAGDFKYCYVRISQFIDVTEQKVAQQFDQCAKEGVKRAILDVRNNPGGLLDSVINLSGRLIDVATKPELAKAIVWQEDRNGKLDSYASDRSAKYADWPLVILVNEGSASASEILAGALKDYGRAAVVGTKTFGKGSVQELRDLPDGSSIKMTIAKWLTPGKTEIDHAGIVPDIDIASATAASEATDAQKEAAIEALRSR